MRIMSSPIWRMHFQGMTKSSPCPNRPKHRPFPGTMMAQICPHRQSTSTSHTYPSRQPSQTLTTSLHFKLENRFPILIPPNSYRNPFYATVDDQIPVYRAVCTFVTRTNCINTNASPSIFVGNGLVPFRCMHHRHPYKFRFIEQTEGLVGGKASPWGEAVA